MNRVTNGVDKLVDAIPKPATRMRRAVDIVTTIIAILGILSVLDILKNWIGG
ncbi:MAG: hypothetical protein LBG87_03930 [Spirochaetaceae bacterium]|jgi:hypothetical protein|nr:hypothetical protein [Spirochaetaceae bacterium]